MEGKEIELRSEEVQEVMGQIPAWIVRWGLRSCLSWCWRFWWVAISLDIRSDHDGDDIDKPASGGGGGGPLVRKDK